MTNFYICGEIEDANHYLSMHSITQHRHIVRYYDPTLKIMLFDKATLNRESITGMLDNTSHIIFDIPDK